MSNLPKKLQEIKERADKDGSMRSDDFGHDTHELLLAESAALTRWLDNDVPRLVRALELALYYIEGDATYEGVCKQIEEILNPTQDTCIHSDHGNGD